MEKPIRILQLTWHGGAGGVSILVKDIIKCLHVDKRFELEVCYAKEKGVVAQEIKNFNVSIFCPGLNSGWDIIGFFKLLKVLRKKSYDIIHLHYLTPLLRIATILAKPKAIIITEHGTIKANKYRKEEFLLNFVNRLLKHTANIYTAVSNDSAEDLIKNGYAKPNKVVVVYNGVDLELFYPRSKNLELMNKLGLPLRDSYPIVGTVRSLTNKMGIDHFIIAASKILEQGYKAYFLIAGDGPLKHKLKELTFNLGIENYFLFLGERRDIPNIISLIDIFVMPSVWETFGIAAAEAMAMEKPVVGYNVGGIREVVADGITGIIVKKRDPYHLADAIINLILNPDMRIAMGKAARVRTQELFDIKKTINTYIELYRKILSE